MTTRRTCFRVRDSGTRIIAPGVAGVMLNATSVLNTSRLCAEPGGNVVPQFGETLSKR